MAIVLVIIGLMVGGITITQTLIRTSQIQQMIGEYDRYAKAVGEFQQKYGQLPGDMTNATTFWGTDVAGSGCPRGNAGDDPKRETCNGDGNGKIGFISTTDAASPDTTSVEWFRAWQHLSNAGMIDGFYNGSRGTGGAAGNGTLYPDLGLNVPRSAIPSGGWMLFYFQNQGLGSGGISNGGSITAGQIGRRTAFTDNYGHVLAFGGPPVDASGNADTATNNVVAYAVLVPAEVMDVDLKMDDGKPGRGKLRVWLNTPTGVKSKACIVPDGSQDDAVYNKTQTNNACASFFVLGY